MVTQRTEYLRPELVGARYIPEDCTTQFTYDENSNGQLNYTDVDAFSGRSQVVRAYPTGEFRDHSEISHSHTLSPLGGAALGLVSAPSLAVWPAWPWACWTRFWLASGGGR